ncbi:MAG: chemotaxis protein CheW [Pyrinomonadaceae bacterium]|nr:chemotaxis protein CheW [Pyrinomonadaceae bacterium]
MNDETPSGRQPTSNNTGEAGSFRDQALRERQLQPTRQLQLLSVGPLVLGIFENEIATIAEWRRPTPLPHAPPAVLGVVSIQARMLTVLDPLNLFCEKPAPLGFPHGLLVALRGDEQIALAIENTGEMLDLAMKDIQPPIESANRAAGGTFYYGDQLVNVIQVKGLFPAALRGRERRRRRF